MRVCVSECVRVCVSEKEKNEKHSERSNGLDTALCKNDLFILGSLISHAYIAATSMH